MEFVNLNLINPSNPSIILAGECEYINSCIKFKYNICIFKMDIHKEDYSIYNYKFEWIHSNYEYYNPYLPIILLGWGNNKHFELLPFNHTNAEYPIEFKIQDINKNKSDINKNALKKYYNNTVNLIVWRVF